MSSSATNIMINIVCPVLGVVISNVMFFSPWSLVMKARKNRHLGNVNPIPFAVMFITNIGFVIYGAMLSNYYIFSSSILGVLLSLFYSITCLTIMAKEAYEDEFTELYLQVEGLILFGLGFWSLIGIIQGSLFLAFDDPHAQATVMIGFICSFFNICYYGAPLSSMAQVISKKDASSLFLPNILVNSLNATLWFSYGLFGLGNIVVWGPSAIGLTLSMLQIALVFMYHEGHWLEAVSGWITHRTIQAKTRVTDETDASIIEVGGEMSSKTSATVVPTTGTRRMSFAVVSTEEAAEQSTMRTRSYSTALTKSGKVIKKRTSSSVSESYNPLTQQPPIV